MFVFACVRLYRHSEPTLRVVLADIGPFGVAWVWTGLTALIEWHAHITTDDRRPRRGPLLSLLCFWAVHPAQFACRVDITQAQPHASLPGAGTGRWGHSYLQYLPGIQPRSRLQFWNWPHHMHCTQNDTKHTTITTSSRVGDGRHKSILSQEVTM